MAAGLFGFEASTAKGASVSKPKLEWTEKGEAGDIDAAVKFLSLLCSDTKAKALVKSLRGSKLIEHAAKDLLRAAQLPLLPSDESHVDADLKRIHKGKALAPVLLVRGDLAAGLPLVVADGYHRICAVCYFDESAPIPCRIADARSPLARG
jgi:hypothetical protein